MVFPHPRLNLVPSDSEFAELVPGFSAISTGAKAEVRYLYPAVARLDDVRLYSGMFLPERPRWPTHVCLTRVRQIVQELLRTRGSDQLQDADSSRIKVYVRKAGHLPDTMVGE